MPVCNQYGFLRGLSINFSFIDSDGRSSRRMNFEPLPEGTADFIESGGVEGCRLWSELV